MNRRENKILKSKERETRSYFDFSLLVLVFIISMFGLVFIYSSSSYIAQTKNLPAIHFVKRQGIALGLGFLAMTVVSFIPYRFYIMKFPIIKVRPTVLILIFAYVLQSYVLIFGGDGRNGSARWIELGAFGTFQPSEISKIAIILYTAMICYKNPKYVDGFFRMVYYMLPVIPLIGLIGIENLSSAIIAGAICLGICFVTSKKYGYFIIIVILLLVAIFIFAKFGGGYRANRIKVWMNLETEPKGFQILQGLYAIASGGFFGQGLGGSVGKFSKIAEAYNDMIFTIICEEIGLFGAFAVILLYVFLIVRLFVVSLHAPDLYGTLIAVGVMIQIGIQAFLNVAVVTNMVPSTGITLPFISYGGSSVIILLIGIGIVLNISKQIKYYV